MSDFVFRPASADNFWRNHPLKEFGVRDFRLIAEEVVIAFERCVNTAKDERSIQSFLEQHPAVLAQLLYSGPRFVLPQKEATATGGKRSAEGNTGN